VASRFACCFSLSLRPVPIGLIAVVQTREISDQSLEKTQSFLACDNQSRPRPWKMHDQRGFGRARRFGSVVNLINPTTCRAVPFCAIPRTYPSFITRRELHYGPTGAWMRFQPGVSGQCVRTGSLSKDGPNQKPGWRMLLPIRPQSSER